MGVGSGSVVPKRVQSGRHLESKGMPALWYACWTKAWFPGSGLLGAIAMA